MKAIFWIIFLFFCFWPGILIYAASNNGEIIIEMHGEPDTKPAAPGLWNQNAYQLTRRLKGKTREQVLYAMPVVSDKDRIVRSDKKEYALVEYYDGGQFRKFMFEAENPQKLIAVAATAADVLAINKKYGVNIGLTQSAFETSYKGKAKLEETALLPEGTTLYKLSYTDINTPEVKDRWFVFDKQMLTLTFETVEEKEAYLEPFRQEIKKADKPVVPAPKQKRRPIVRKALVSGGTVQDQMYMPRAILTQPLPPMPTLKEAGQGN